MAASPIDAQRKLTGKESFFDENEIIVSKSDLTGRITYCNDVFVRVSGYSESELLGQPHSILRHPDMPRSVFKLMWDTIQSGAECFAYVLNRTKAGDHYWVLAHVTPSYDKSGRMVGFHSSRRSPDAAGLEAIRAIYRDVLAAENRYESKRAQVEAGEQTLRAALDRQGMPYDEFIFSICAA
jgi:PAS domain S-box-containing protein